MDLDPIVKIYSEEFDKHGDTPLGQCTKTEKARTIRLNKLAHVVRTKPFSVLDFGCGTGLLVDVLTPMGMGHYVGIEICENVKAAAERKYPQWKFRMSVEGLKTFDYVFVGGTFNVRESIPNEKWTDWVEETVKMLWEMTEVGLAMNFMTPTPDWKDEGMWYPESVEQVIGWLDAQRYEVERKYGLHEVTLLAFR